MLRDDDGDTVLLDYCRALAADLRGEQAFGEHLRVLLDTKSLKPATKRWNWVKKGAPLILEIGGRDVAGGNVSMIRRDRLYTAEGKLNGNIQTRDAFVTNAGAVLESIQVNLFTEARHRMDSNIRRDIADFAALTAYFTSADLPGWVEIEWARPSGAALDAVVERIKALKLTVRNVPNDAAPATGLCIFTGEPAVERILVGRSY